MADGYVGHFVFWKTVQPIDVIKAVVKGQFGGMDVRSTVIHMIGNPAEKNGEPVDPEYKDLHLSGYELAVSPPFQANVLVSNQFGEKECQLGKPVFLLMPAFKSHEPGKLPDDKPKGPHFLCYQVIQGPTVDKTVKLNDQFLTQEVKNPRLAYLGVPVDKNGEGMWNEDVHLALYDINPFELDPWKIVYIRDQFQKEQQLTAMRSVFLAVPSKKKVL
ncbi:MAG TPA: hypothetical protein VE974_29160 [Thermoanaerobaculia bacterium]|nr:hypothetical protein [Thermoanaerobaculia bacterium]